MKRTGLYLGIVSLMTLVTCNLQIENPAPDPRENPEYAEWLIPKNRVIIKELEENLEPPLLNPDFITVSEVAFLSPEDHVLGVNIDGSIRAYPICILNYHEVVNDLFQQHEIMISYDPLTGTAAAWDRGNLKGFASTFKTSIYIYNSNQILFDEETASHWLPMQFQCVNGALEGFDPELFSIIETKWSTWRSMFPGSKILSNVTGYPYDYAMDRYQLYRSNDSIRYDTQPIDPRIPLKEEVHGILVNDRAKVYPQTLFGDTTTLIQDNFQGLSVVVVGNNAQKFIVSFERRIPTGVELDLTPINDGPVNVIMEDETGNQYDLFGLAVAGPDKGRQLNSTRSLFGYWFSVAAIYPDPIIYQQ